MSTKNIEVYCVNAGRKVECAPGTTLLELAEMLEITMSKAVVGAYVNNAVKELGYSIYKPKVVEYFDLASPEGQKMYQRSLCLIMAKALHDVDSSKIVLIDHSISKGLYCEIKTADGQDVKPSLEFVEAIKKRMIELVSDDMPFERTEVPSSEAADIFKSFGQKERVSIFSTRSVFYSSIYSLGGYLDYYSGYLLPSTGMANVFDLIPFYDGMLLRLPTDYLNVEIEPLLMQPKLFEIFREHKDWVKLLKFGNVDSLNELVQSGRSGDVIKVAEALHEKKFAQIADRIKQAGNIRLVLLAGPSSSGKTTSSMRLCVQLRVAGLKPVQISLDNYFVDRDKTPRDEKGEYDFEALEAVDYRQFNQDMLDMMSGKAVDMPVYNFLTGKRERSGNLMTADSDTVFVVEGIHALNPAMSQMIPPDRKFKIYVSALTQIRVDFHNRIPTTDNRLLRRIIRDYRYRGYSAEETIKRWPGVRAGEDKNIFPYQEEADVMFNSALPYELGVVKKYAVPLLRNVSERSPQFGEAQRLLKVLTFFREFPDEEIPPTSILREFLTGSSFSY